MRPGDSITAEVRVREWDPGTRTVHLAARCFNQRGEDVVTGESALLVEPEVEK